MDDMKFNLTKDMADKIKEYNKLKNELELNSSKYTEEEIKDIEKKMGEYRNKFIKLFRKHNKKEINDYLNNH